MSAQSTPIVGAGGMKPPVVPAEKPRSCGTCQYWFRSEPKSNAGTCFFDPPKALPVAGPPGFDGQPKIGLSQIRPPTLANEICHNHTAEGEMHAAEALVAAVADLIEPLCELRDYIKHMAQMSGGGKAG